MQPSGAPQLFEQCLRICIVALLCRPRPYQMRSNNCVILRNACCIPEPGSRKAEILSRCTCAILTPQLPPLHHYDRRPIQTVHCGTPVLSRCFRSRHLRPLIRLLLPRPGNRARLDPHRQPLSLHRPKHPEQQPRGRQCNRAPFPSRNQPRRALPKTRSPSILIHPLQKPANLPLRIKHFLRHRLKFRPR